MTMILGTLLTVAVLVLIAATAYGLGIEVLAPRTTRARRRDRQGRR